MSKCQLLNVAHYDHSVVLVVTDNALFNPDIVMVMFWNMGQIILRRSITSTV